MITAYLANRATGESLLGLSVAQDVSHFHEVARVLFSLLMKQIRRKRSLKNHSTPSKNLIMANCQRLRMRKMSNNLQLPFNFPGNGALGSPLSPEGYKGFAGFHKYWGKKPIEMWRFLIENLTLPDDIVLDPFLGSGLIAKECVDHNCRFIGFDVNPISIELTKLYLHPPDYIDLGNAIYRIERRVKPLINSMYQLSDGNIVTHFLWNKDQITRVWTKHGSRKVEINPTKLELKNFQSAEEYQPIRLRELCLFDNTRINSQKNLSLTKLFSPRALRAIDLIKSEIEQYSGNLKRALHLILSASVGQMSNMVFAVSKRGKTKGIETDKIEVGSWVVGYWCPAQQLKRLEFQSLSRFHLL